ncbi:MAG TPA: hypothetical protein VIN75_21240 [Burkholderiaceae bacterium]
MGMHFGIVAVKAGAAQFVDAFATAWPHHEPAARVDVTGLEALSDWMRATQRNAAAAGGAVDVFGFWQDGMWAVLFDPSYAQASDRRALAVLSQRFGLVLSFVVETAGGCAFFEAFDGGQLVRRIQSIDGVLTTDGVRLPQEAGLPADRYFEDETRQLQRAFGLTGMDGVPADVPVIGAAYVDRTDYGTPRRRPSAAADRVATPSLKRPWWRVW